MQASNQPSKPASGQIPIPFEHRPALGLDDFLVAAPNADAVAWIDRWPDWPAPAMVICGAEGAGKTHLVNVFLEATRGRLIGPDTIAADDIDTVIGDSRALAVDGLDAVVAESPALEEAVLHLYNLAREADVKLLLTALTPPARWRLSLKDLSSRLNAAPVATINPPDDALLAALLVKQFGDRQIAVSQEVIAYMTSRMTRSFEGARYLVEQVDRLALSEKRAVTIPLVRRVFDETEPENG